MDYLPISEHGVIGDLHSVALVGTDGAIDWYCTPRFDSPSVFASILDAEKGGFWRISTIKHAQVKQLTATTSAPHRTGSRATRARSRSAPSGTSRP